MIQNRLFRVCLKCKQLKYRFSICACKKSHNDVSKDYYQRNRDRILKEKKQDWIMNREKRNE